jgi:CBS domain-containing protein
MIKLAREKTVRVSDVMSTNLIVLDVHMSLGEAAAVLSEHRISGAPVVSGSAKPLGVVSRRRGRAALQDRHLDGRHAGSRSR